MKNTKKISRIILSVFCAVFMLGNVHFSLADDLDPGRFDSILSSTGKLSAKNDIANRAGLSETSVPAMIGSIIKIILGLSGTVALIFVIWGGIKWMLSKGEAGKIAEARKIMTAGMIGIAIIAASYAITEFVLNQISAVAK